MSFEAQKTLLDEIQFKGIGVHSGQETSITLSPAAPNYGIRFQRQNSDTALIAHVSNVTDVSLCTVLGNPKTNGVATIEHLMSALMGLDVDNVHIECAGPEIPIMDGSAYEFATSISEVGLLSQAASRKYIEILEPIYCENEDAKARLVPANQSIYDVTIDFDCSSIGHQSYTMIKSPERFLKEIASARTFGFLKDLEYLNKNGQALGASLENTIGIGQYGILNQDGLRYKDEFARHKLLDAIGDLALAGAPIKGHFESYKGGHALNALLVKTLLAAPQSWQMVDGRSLAQDKIVQDVIAKDKIKESANENANAYAAPVLNYPI